MSSGQDKIWDYFQNSFEDSFNQSDSRLKYFAKKIRATERVLNIGIGAGIFEGLLVERGVRISSLDPSSTTVENIVDKYGDSIEAKVGYATKIPFEDEYFDVVVMSEVLEHLEQDSLVGTLEEVRRVLKSDGRFIGSVPARENLQENVVVCPDCGKVFHRWGHEQSFNVLSLRDALKSHFLIDSVGERYFYSWSSLNWRGKMLAMAKTLLVFLGVNVSNCKIVFSVNKK